MGAALSSTTPPPLVQVSAPGGKVLVPPGTAFTVHPPSYHRTRSSPTYAHRSPSGPVYLPASPPAGCGHQHPHYGGRGLRPQPGTRRPRRPILRPDIDIFEGGGSEDSEESVMGEMMEGMWPGGYARGMRGQGGGMGVGMGRRGGVPGGFEGMDMRPRSAPEMQMPMGTYPGLGMGMGMPSPRMGRMGMNGMGGINGMGPGGMGGMGGMPPSGMPPEYTSNPSPMPPRYSGGLGAGGGGGMPGAGMNPYATYPRPSPSPPSSDGAPPPQGTRRTSGRPPGHHERIPMGAYATASEKPRKTSRSHTEPQTSAQLNRGQPANRKVGPSGKEWIDGDAFLDACVCTTGCKCRKSQRVLYRSRNDRRRSGDGDSSDGDPEYGSGEIRYILKEDVGRDCGDHSGCTKSGGESEKEEKSKKGKNKKEEKKERKEQFAGFKEELLEALDERFQDMRKENQQRAKPSSTPASPFGRPNVRPSPFMMDESGMDPRMAQQMGLAMGADPYGMGGMPGMGRMPPGMPDPMGKRSMRPPGMSMGPMAAAGMDFEDEMSMADMDGMGPMGMGNPYAGMMGKKPMRPDFMSPRRTRGPGKFGGMHMDMDPMSLYARASAMRGRGGMMGGRRQGRGGRRPDFGSDDFDIGPSRRPGMSRRSNDEDEVAFGGGGLGDDDEDGIPATRRRVTNSPARRPGARSSRDHERQPRADTDDDDAY